MTNLTGLALAAVASFALAACEPARTSLASSSLASSTTAAHSVQGIETASGSLHGASGHVTSGTASVFLEDGQWVVSLGSDFSFDGAPDAHVALGHDGYRKDAQLGALKSNNGSQVYVIPANLDVADFNEIWIWCGQFAVPLGSAKLKLL